ncbi:MAG: hypothetical protein ACR2LJ_06980 [Acidimicrobiales bacterium]
MSTIWTPSGERPVHRDDSPAPPPRRTPPSAPGAGAGPGAGQAEPGEEEMAARMAEVQRELLQTPAVVVIANHCIGLFQLAALHLDQEQPNLPQAQLAIDALGAIVEGLGERLGDDEGPLRDALTSLRLAFVEVAKQTTG